MHIGDTALIKLNKLSKYMIYSLSSMNFTICFTFSFDNLSKYISPNACYFSYTKHKDFP